MQFYYHDGFIEMSFNKLNTKYVISYFSKKKKDKTIISTDC